MTQTKIANEAGISQQMVSAILRGCARPSWKTAKRLVQVIPGTTIDIWMEGTADEIRAAIGRTNQAEQADSAKLNRYGMHNSGFDQ